MSKKRLLTAAGLFGIYTQFPFRLIYSEPIAATKIRLFTQETEYLHWKLQDIQWSNTAPSFNKGIFCCCKRRRRNQQRNKAENTKMCEWYEETKERKRSDENSEKKCVV